MIAIKEIWQVCPEGQSSGDPFGYLWENVLFDMTIPHAIIFYVRLILFSVDKILETIVGLYSP